MFVVVGARRSCNTFMRITIRILIVITLDDSNAAMQRRTTLPQHVALSHVSLRTNDPMHDTFARTFAA